MAADRNARRLRVESLESRQLMAADLHNIFAPLDVNDDGRVTASDALQVINHLSQRSSVGQPLVASTVQRLSSFLDSNDDGKITPADALMVINGLNSRGSIANVQDDGWVRVSGDDQQRLGARLSRNGDGSVQLDVRLQHSQSNGAHDIFLDGTWLGTLQTDQRGRGALRLESNLDLAGRLAELIIGGQPSASLRVESVAELSLAAEGESNNPERAHENRNLINTAVLTAPLAINGQNRGEVLFARAGDQTFLGVYARGLVADQTYQVSIGGVVVANLQASRAGVIAQRIDVNQLTNFPDIVSGSSVSVADYTGQFRTFRERLRIPDQIYIANLTGSGRLGGAQLGLSQDRTVIRVLLTRAERNTTYDLMIDGVKIAEVRSNSRGLIEYFFNSQNGGSLLAPLPSLNSQSVISVGNLASGRLRLL